MPDYSKTIIYKIQHEDNEELVYVGSTTNFTKRKCCHKSISYNPNDKSYNCKLYKMINDNGGWSCFKMTQIKEFPCNNKREAETEEDKIMLELKANMNSHRASRSKKKYRNDNQEKIAQGKKDYYKANKERLSQGKKDYYNENKEKTLQQKKDYYEKNKEQILQKINQKITCECGCVVNKGDLAKHKRTKKHAKLLNETEEQ